MAAKEVKFGDSARKKMLVGVNVPVSYTHLEYERRD